MNPRRSKSVKLVSARQATKQQPLEVSVPDDADPRMSSSAANTVYCCVARGRKVIYSYHNTNSTSSTETEDTESTAALCLEHAPPHHRHYVHTAGSRSYAFLTSPGDGHTFFAIIDPCVGSAAALHFLERVRDAFFRHTHHRNGFHDDAALVPAVRRLVASLEKMPHAAFVLDDVDSGRGGGGGSNANDNSSSASTCTSSTTTTSSKVPLLGKSGSRKEKKKKKSSRDKQGVSKSSSPTGGDDGENEHHHHGGRGVRIDMPTDDDVGGMSLERTSSQSRLRRQQSSRSLWVRHLKIIVVVDAVICLILFAAWLAVCKGFQCVSG